MWCRVLTRTFAVTGRHSKNVQGKKDKLDSARMKLYDRLTKKIIMVAKAGGPDPTSNTELARILKQAHSAKLPKDNVERALKRSKTDTESFTSGTYEIFGHGGVGLIVASLTDSTNRANQKIKLAAKEADMKMASNGSIIFQFDKKGVFKPEGKIDQDAVFELAVGNGIEEIDFITRNSDNEDVIVTSVEELNNLQDVLSQNKIDGVASIEYLPKELVAVENIEEYQKNLEIVDILEDLEDVDAVFHNMRLDKE